MRNVVACRDRVVVHGVRAQSRDGEVELSANAGDAREVTVTPAERLATAEGADSTDRAAQLLDEVAACGRRAASVSARRVEGKDQLPARDRPYPQPHDAPRRSAKASETAAPQLTLVTPRVVLHSQATGSRQPAGTPYLAPYVPRSPRKAAVEAVEASCLCPQSLRQRIDNARAAGSEARANNDPQPTSAAAAGRRCECERSCRPGTFVVADVLLVAVAKPPIAGIAPAAHASII